MTAAPRKSIYSLATMSFLRGILKRLGGTKPVAKPVEAIVEEAPPPKEEEVAVEAVEEKKEPEPVVEQKKRKASPTRPYLSAPQSATIQHRLLAMLRTPLADPGYSLLRDLLTQKAGDIADLPLAAKKEIALTALDWAAASQSLAAISRFRVFMSFPSTVHIFPPLLKRTHEMASLTIRGLKALHASIRTTCRGYIGDVDNTVACVREYCFFLQEAGCDVVATGFTDKTLPLNQLVEFAASSVNLENAEENAGTMIELSCALIRLFVKEFKADPNGGSGSVGGSAAGSGSGSGSGSGRSGSSTSFATPLYAAFATVLNSGLPFSTLLELGAEVKPSLPRMCAGIDIGQKGGAFVPVDDKTKLNRRMMIMGALQRGITLGLEKNMIPVRNALPFILSSVKRGDMELTEFFISPSPTYAVTMGDKREKAQVALRALELALQFGHLEMVEYLLGQGALRNCLMFYPASVSMERKRIAKLVAECAMTAVRLPCQCCFKECNVWRPNPEDSLSSSSSSSSSSSTSSGAGSSSSSTTSTSGAAGPTFRPGSCRDGLKILLLFFKAGFRDTVLPDGSCVSSFIVKNIGPAINDKTTGLVTSGGLTEEMALKLFKLYCANHARANRGCPGPGPKGLRMWKDLEEEAKMLHHCASEGCTALLEFLRTDVEIPAKDLDLVIPVGGTEGGSAVEWHTPFASALRAHKFHTALKLLDLGASISFPSPITYVVPSSLRGNAAASASLHTMSFEGSLPAMTVVPAGGLGDGSMLLTGSQVSSMAFSAASASVEGVVVFPMGPQGDMAEGKEGKEDQDDSSLPPFSRDLLPANFPSHADPCDLLPPIIAAARWDLDGRLCVRLLQAEALQRAKETVANEAADAKVEAEEFVASAAAAVTRATAAAISSETPPSSPPQSRGNRSPSPAAAAAAARTSSSSPSPVPVSTSPSSSPRIPDWLKTREVREAERAAAAAARAAAAVIASVEAKMETGVYHAAEHNAHVKLTALTRRFHRTARMGPFLAAVLFKNAVSLETLCEWAEDVAALARGDAAILGSLDDAINQACHGTPLLPGVSIFLSEESFLGESMYQRGFMAPTSSSRSPSPSPSPSKKQPATTRQKKKKAGLPSFLIEDLRVTTPLHAALTLKYWPLANALLRLEKLIRVDVPAGAVMATVAEISTAACFEATHAAETALQWRKKTGKMAVIAAVGEDFPDAPELVDKVPRDVREKIERVVLRDVNVAQKEKDEAAARAALITASFYQIDAASRHGMHGSIESGGEGNIPGLGLPADMEPYSREATHTFSTNSDGLGSLVMHVNDGSLVLVGAQLSMSSDEASAIIATAVAEGANPDRANILSRRELLTDAENEAKMNLTVIKTGLTGRKDFG